MQPTPNSSTQITISPTDLGLGNAPTTATTNAGTITALLNTAYMLAGIVAVVIIIIGGIRYVTSNGDSSQIQAAKNTILYAVVGLVVVIMAAAITKFVIGHVTGA